MRTSGFLKRVFLTVAVCTIAAQAFPARNQHKRNTRAEVEAADRQWRSAELAGDADTMDRLLADDYLGILSGGRVVTKEQQLERTRNRQTRLTRFEVSDQKFKEIGSSVVIVTSLTELEGSMDGRPVHGRFRSIRIYRRMAGSWKLTNFEGTRLREGDPGDTSSH